MLHDHLAILCRFGCLIDEIDVDEVRRKIEKLNEELDMARADLEKLEDEDKIAAAKAWITSEEIHLSWYEAQIDFAETGRESTKQ